MRVKTTKSTTHCCCYNYAVFYDIDDKSYDYYYGAHVYYKDMCDPIYKLYNNIDMIINDSELCVYVKYEAKNY